LEVIEGAIRRLHYVWVYQLMSKISQSPVTVCHNVWAAESETKRELHFQGIKFAGKPLLSQIQNRIIAMQGNLVAFPLLADGQLRVREAESTQVVETFTSLPTKGVFAETLLSRNSATERLDSKRTVNYEYLRLTEAANIEKIDMDRTKAHKVSKDIDKVNPDFTSGFANQVDAEDAPDPVNLGNVVKSLAKFSSADHLQATMSAATSGLQAALTADVTRQQQASDMLKKSMEATTSLAKHGMDQAGKLAQADLDRKLSEKCKGNREKMKSVLKEIGTKYEGITKQQQGKFLVDQCS